MIVIGPGLGRDPWIHDTVVKVGACQAAVLHDYQGHLMALAWDEVGC